MRMWWHVLERHYQFVCVFPSVPNVREVRLLFLQWCMVLCARVWMLQSHGSHLVGRQEWLPCDRHWKGEIQWQLESIIFLISRIYVDME